jgi:superfamily I DNA/RNA helicase/Zn-dependent peptidase ImmA (M78 family)
MSMWSEIRVLARAWHEELFAETGELPAADDLIERAREATSTSLMPLPADDVLLEGADGLYDRDDNRILYSMGLAPETRRFTIAHEFGHQRLHDTHGGCSSVDVDFATPAEPELSVVGEIDAYSPKERAEAQANLFAREFLLPRPKLRDWWAAAGESPPELAAKLGLPLDLILQQLADAVLLPDEDNAEPQSASPPPPDKTQLQAAKAGFEPHQVRAGPGTGKTRTLVARIKWLVDSDENPASIVALTYSNGSSVDLSRRLRSEIGELAPAVWSGTFHAFGLELLRKYGEVIGIKPNLQPLDRSDCLFLLEELLPSLSLEYYLDLREPLQPLKGVLNAISRAKDQLATPDDYARLAAAIGKDPSRDVEAAKAAEVARIYAVYQAALKERGHADFGDLIMRAHELLAEHAEVAAAVRAKTKHVLVDEYQDMNRASALFLKELVTPGQGPWVVGDARQSIYRFRGASPLNMTEFARDFPGATFTDLGVNYRSGGRIVRTFSSFGTEMGKGVLPAMAHLDAHRGEEQGAVHYSVGATFEAEAEGIAETIRARVRGGDKFSNHVVLARSHTILAKLSAHFERSGMPSLYFGDFFERAEVRDYLSLLSVASEWEGLGILRIGQEEPYYVSLADIAALCTWRRNEKVSMIEALRRLDDVSDLSDAGRAGLGRLANDLAGSAFMTSPHGLILESLFIRGRARLGLLSEDNVAAQQARLAIYQLLQVAFDFRAPPNKDPKSAFFAHVRRLELLDEEKEFRRMPAAAAGIDAVRLMTVHASKGLEFPSVHLSTLTTRHFPAPNRHNPCPPPDGLVPNDPLMGREAEEEGLFFVALSRAKDSLHLSRPLRYGGWTTANPSRLLEPIAGHLDRPLNAAANWVDEGPRPPDYLPLAPLHPLPAEISIRAVESYQHCPRQYYYEFGLGIGGFGPKSPYLGLQSTLRKTLSWARTIPDAEARQAGWRKEFDEHWEGLGLADGPLGTVYRASAEQMVERAIELASGKVHPVDRKMEVGGSTITARADHIAERDGGLVIQRLKTARLAKDKESAKARYGALLAMVGLDHPGWSISFEHVSLVDGQTKPDLIKADVPAKARAAIEAELANIGAGLFPPKPSDRNCPNCAFYFACPAHGIALGG